MKNADWCIYTYKHRLAFKFTVERLIKDPADRAELLKRAEVHDLDKVLLYQFFDQRTSQLHHVNTQPHHLEYKGPRTAYDLLETVIDYECAPYTKPDKPLNAWDFTHLMQKNGWVTEEEARPLYDIMHHLGIDRSESPLDDPAVHAFVKNMPEVTEEMVLLELFRYLQQHPEQPLPDPDDPPKV